MPRYTRNNRRKAINTVNSLNGLETLSPRLVLSGMVMFSPTPVENTTGEHSSHGTTVHIREANPRESEELVPTAQPANNISESDIPEDMRSTDEAFGGRDFWVMGSRPLDHVSQQVSGPGTEQYPDLGPPLAFDPASLLAPGPIGGAPASNLESIFSQIPSLSDVANDGDGGFWDWVKSLFSGDEEEETPAEPEPDTPPEDTWEDVHAPLWSPTVVKAQAEFWNEGMSETSGGLSTLTTHLEKRDK